LSASFEHLLVKSHKKCALIIACGFHGQAAAARAALAGDVLGVLYAPVAILRSFEAEGSGR
jgi:hypothetical protein